MKFEELITLNKGKLTDNDSRIANFLQNNITLIQELTLEDIAEGGYSSRSTVLRFLSKIGFNNFSEFKYFIASSFSVDVDPKIQIKKFISYVYDFDLTKKSSEFCNAINQRNNIYIFSTGVDQYLQAQNLENQLLKKGILSTTKPLYFKSMVIQTILDQIQPNDLIIIFSTSGTNDVLNYYFKDLVNKNTIISFTVHKEGWIQSHSNLNFSLKTTSYESPKYQLSSGLIHMLITVLTDNLK